MFVDLWYTFVRSFLHRGHDQISLTQQRNHNGLSVSIHEKLNNYQDSLESNIAQGDLLQPGSK